MRKLIILIAAAIILTGAGIAMYAINKDAVSAKLPETVIPVGTVIEKVAEDEKTAPPVIVAVDAPMTKQRAFDVEEDFETPVPLPAEAWKLIVDREENSHFRDELLEENASERLTQASRVDIDGKSEADYVVKGRGILNGANVTRFYIILSAGDGKFEMALSISTKVLFLSDQRDRHGARKIDTVSLTAVEAFERSYLFDGKQYQFKSVTVSKL